MSPGGSVIPRPKGLEHDRVETRAPNDLLGKSSAVCFGVLQHDMPFLSSDFATAIKSSPWFSQNPDLRHSVHGFYGEDGIFLSLYGANCAVRVFRVRKANLVKRWWENHKE